MAEQHRAYLALLGELGASLDRLSQLAQEKSAAVHHSDLLALDEVLKQEQAMTLNLRGLEQKRQKLLAELGLEQVSLAELPGRYPPELAQQARQAAADLRARYQNYRSHADAARTALELNLHQIELVISAAGGEVRPASAGYQPPDAEPPKNMKTDFRA